MMSLCVCVCRGGGVLTKPTRTCGSIERPMSTQRACAAANTWSENVLKFDHGAKLRPAMRPLPELRGNCWSRISCVRIHAACPPRGA